MDKKIKGYTNTLEWEADFKPQRISVMSFTYADRDMFDCGGVEIGFLKELHGMQKYLRLHTSEKTSWHSVESEVIQPFGSEPAIRRKIEQSGNFMRVITDVLIKTAMSLEFLKIDTIRIRGEWEDITIYYQSLRENSEILSQKIDIKDIDEKEISFKAIPLAVVFTDKNGIQLEIGTGYDLWRWNNAARFSADSKFILKKEKNYILFERIPVLWKNEREMQKFNFRFSWYFAWGKKPLTEGKVQEKAANLLFQNNKLTGYQAGICDYKLDYANWPESARSSNSNEPCFSSRQTAKLLKDFLRKALSKLGDEDKSINLHEVSSHICVNSGHLERNKLETFIHWDYWDMMVFWEWANNFFVSNKKKFILNSNNPIMSFLPSSRGMSDSN